MTKSLSWILEIEWKFLGDVDIRGLQYADQLFQIFGAPTEGRALADALENILLRMQREAITYPKILLLRRKQLQRGTWLPRESETSEHPPQPAPPTSPARSEAEIIADARATYTSEQFERWLKMHEHAKLLTREAKDAK